MWWIGNWDTTSATIAQAYAAWLQLPVTTAAAGVTAWAAIAASKAAMAADRSVAVAQDTAKRQLRAYVLVEGAILNYERGGLLSPLPVAGSQPIAQVRIRNSGQTPAHGVKIRTSLCMRPLPVDQATLILTNLTINSEVDLGANSGANSAVASPGVLDAATAAAIPLGGQGIFLIGEVIYRDIFNNEWRTHFSLSNASGHRDGIMSFTSFGNSAT